MLKSLGKIVKKAPIKSPIKALPINNVLKVAQKAKPKGLIKNLKDASKKALIIAKKNPIKILAAGGLAAVGIYSAVEAKETYDKKQNAKFTITSITSIDSNIINIKFDNLDNIEIDSRDQIILKNTNTIPVLNDTYSIHELISNNEIEVLADITSDGTSGEMLLDTDYLKEFMNESGETTGDIVKGVGNVAGKAGGVVGGGLLVFLSGLLGTTPDKLKFYGTITISVIFVIIFLMILLYIRKIFI